MRRFLFSVVLLGVLGTGGIAAAQSDGPDGLFEADFRLGPGIGVSNASTQFRLHLSVGYDLTPHERYHIYLVGPLEFGFGGGATIIGIVPGVEGDIRLTPNVPVYIYPFAGIGVAFDFPTGIDSITALALRFGVGVKYILDRKWTFSFEPFNLELYPVGGDPSFNGNKIGTYSNVVVYNLMFGVGAIF